MSASEPRIKICGLTREEDARSAVEAGASYLGFVFAENSPRRVRAQQLLEWWERIPEGVERVGVFRDQPLEFVMRMLDALDLDLVQLHGSETGEQWSRLPVRLIEARAVGVEGPAVSRFGGRAWAELFDRASSRGGGGGEVFDWRWAEEPARRRRVFLAGGLDAGNVAEAVRRVRPFAVDVSSGVEAAPGIKDPQRLRAFCAAAREAYAE